MLPEALARAVSLLKDRLEGTRDLAADLYTLTCRLLPPGPFTCPSFGLLRLDLLFMAHVGK
jgi:hypothetical protein